MEILRRTSKSGKVFRIYDNCISSHIYEIEFKKVYYTESGSECVCWFPAFEPKNKLFTNLDDAKEELEKLLED